MWELPISLVILMSGFIYLHQRHYEHELDKMNRDDDHVRWESSEALGKEFDEYKKRVDALTLKVGFKL